MQDVIATITRQQYGFSKVVALNYQQVVEKPKEALKQEGLVFWPR